MMESIADRGNKINTLDLDDLIEESVVEVPSTNGTEPLSTATWADLGRVIGPIEWDWPGWLARGFLNILAAEPGKGKSALALRIAQSYLCGAAWPDGTPFTGELGKVLWCESEAAQALNLERAKAWGLPLENILTPLDDPLADVQLDNPEHRKAIAAIASRPDVRLVIVDSLRGSHKRNENDSETMTIIKWLAELGRNIQRPVLATHHLRKRGLFDTGDGVNLDRLRGSSAIIQPARLVWALDAPDPAKPDVVRLSVIKSNLAKPPEPIGVTVDENGVRFSAAPEMPKTETLQDRAADLLLALLADGPMTADEIQAEVEQAGLSWHAAKRAKAKLGIVSVKPGGVWHWSLPARD